MAEVYGLCHVCGKVARHVCRICGRPACSDHYDASLGICSTCKRGRAFKQKTGETKGGTG